MSRLEARTSRLTSAQAAATAWEQCPGPCCAGMAIAGPLGETHGVRMPHIHLSKGRCPGSG
eukprot:12588441-Prorocentrum_lima.AAC.1